MLRQNAGVVCITTS